MLRPLGGGDDDVAGVFPALEAGRARPRFPPPTADDLGDAASRRPAAHRPARRVPVHRRPVPLPGRHRRRTPRLPVRPAADGAAAGHRPAADRRRRRHRQDHRGRADRRRAARPGRRPAASPCCARPALAEQWQRELRDEVRHRRRAGAALAPSRGSNAACCMDESLFDRYPHVVVSTDFIKSDRPPPRVPATTAPSWSSSTRRTPAVADGATGRRARHQRYELLRELAADPAPAPDPGHRHPALAARTRAFRNLLGLLDPDLATVDLDDASRPGAAGRATSCSAAAPTSATTSTRTPPFPDDRADPRGPLHAQPGLPRAVRRRPRLRPRAGRRRPSRRSVRQRVRWWSALALLRALASTPARRPRPCAPGPPPPRRSTSPRPTPSAAPASSTPPTTRRSRPPTSPPAPTSTHADDDGDTAIPASRRRLLAMARQAEALDGPEHRPQARRCSPPRSRRCSPTGYDPIVFCRFIHTAEYVAEHLAPALGAGVDVAAVTGTLPPAEREQRIARPDRHRRPARPGRHRLPVRGRQPPGRASTPSSTTTWPGTRPGTSSARAASTGSASARRSSAPSPSTAPTTASTASSSTSCIRKHQAIRKATGVVRARSPTSPTASSRPSLEGLLLRGKDPDQLSLDLGLTEKTDALHSGVGVRGREGEGLAHQVRPARHPPRRGRRARSPTIRAALGAHGEVEDFVRRDAACPRRQPSPPPPTGSPPSPAPCPLGVRDAPARRAREPLPFHREPPSPRAATPSWPAPTPPSRPSPATSSTPPSTPPSTRAARPARRAGVIRTQRRHDPHHAAAGPVPLPPRPARPGRRPPARRRGRPAPRLPRQPGRRPVARRRRRRRAARGRARRQRPRRPGREPWQHACSLGSPAVTAAPRRAGRRPTPTDLLDAHRRVRAGAGAARRGLTVSAQRPVDVLGVYVYLPAAGGAA